MVFAGGGGAGAAGMAVTGTTVEGDAVLVAGAAGLAGAPLAEGAAAFTLSGPRATHTAAPHSSRRDRPRGRERRISS